MLTRLSLPAVCLLAASLLPAVPVQSAVVKRTETYPANGHQYHLLRADDALAGLTWAEGEAQARALGGSLVAINDAAENSWLLETFRGGSLGVLDYYIWIGLSDAQQEGVYTWSNGEPLTFSSWYPGEPNNFEGDEDFVHIWNFENGLYKWNDNDDTRLWITDVYAYPFSAIAEVIVPEPPTGL